MPSPGTPSSNEQEKKWRLGFWSLIATQFQGAFNENGLKFLVIYLILGTFLAIILGSISGSFLAEAFSRREIYSGLLLLGFTVVGLLWSFGISRVPAADPSKRFHLVSLIDVWSPMKLIRKDRVLWLAVLGNTYFFFVAGLLQFDIFIYGQDVLHIRATEGGFLQAAVAIGIGLGSFAAGYLSAGKSEHGFIPLGSMGMTVLGLCLAIPDLSFRSVLLLLAALGFFGGFFIVPISALIQHQPEEDKKGVVIGTANWLSFVGIGAASGVYYAATHFAHLSPGGIFFWSAIATLGATAYVLWLLPDS